MYPPQGAGAGIDISDADAVVGDVKSSKTFYSVTLPKKTGTLPTVALAPASDAYPQGYHPGEGGGLPAVDADLVVTNIKSGITIFGKLGTFTGTITHDTQGTEADNQDYESISKDVQCQQSGGIGIGGDLVVLTKTLTCLQATVIHAHCAVIAFADGTNATKAQLYVDGVAQGESGFLPLNDFTTGALYNKQANKAVASGARTFYLNLHNYSGSDSNVVFVGGIGGGCSKL